MEHMQCFSLLTSFVICIFRHLVYYTLCVFEISVVFLIWFVGTEPHSGVVPYFMTIFCCCWIQFTFLPRYPILKNKLQANSRKIIWLLLKFTNVETIKTAVLHEYYFFLKLLKMMKIHVSREKGQCPNGKAIEIKTKIPKPFSEPCL